MNNEQKTQKTNQVKELSLEELKNINGGGTGVGGDFPALPKAAHSVAVVQENIDEG
ncbi:CCRG-2 family RiPP [Algicola sagamiensis]|uniref:CCRG-2 family RiPP n=1 Tax=Algicola sagamiensis TaxID=163869 RepID=UPI000362C017|nr:CCRG-2 family RiPP [Algicola sagamiensis]